MALVNHQTREVTFKIVYAGTPLGGKTTNLQYVHSRLDATQRGGGLVREYYHAEPPTPLSCDFVYCHEDPAIAAESGQHYIAT